MRNITKIVTAQTYTQFRFMKMKDLTLFRISSVHIGKIADNKQTPKIKIKLGSVTPLLNVVLILDKNIIICY